MTPSARRRCGNREPDQGTARWSADRPHELLPVLGQPAPRAADRGRLRAHAGTAAARRVRPSAGDVAVGPAVQARRVGPVDVRRALPLDKAGADLLFGFISPRYERRSLVVTTNLPFARWSEVFLDPTAAAAVIERIVHHATVLQTSGNSYRLAAAKRNQAPAADEKEQTRVDRPGPCSDHDALG